MSRELNYKDMGVSEKMLKSASIRFIKESSPLNQFVNDSVIEDKKDEIKVVKEEKGTFRPYLVLYNKILHAKTAMHMTSSLPEDRIEAENRIWGSHLIRTPEKLYHYIGVSALRGGLLDKSRISVIDKDRFIFVTDDSLVEITASAMGAEDLGYSLNTHISNVYKIINSLEKDFPPEYTAEIVSQGTTQRWTYSVHDANPILFNPSAAYLALYINAGLQFDNKHLKLTPADLENRLMALKVAGAAYYKYNEHLKTLKNLQDANYKLYTAYKNARYYNDLISERTYDKMWEEDKKKKSEATWKNIAGHPNSLYGKMDMEARLMECLISARVKTGQILDSQKFLLSIYEKEKEVNEAVKQAVYLAIEDVNRVKRENINLSSFNFNIEQVDNLTKEAETFNSFIEERYSAMAKEFEKAFVQKRAKAAKRREESIRREVQSQYEALANEYAINELKKGINKTFFGLFDKAYKQQASSNLVPTEEEMAEFKTLLSHTVVNKSEEIVIGQNLNAKLIADFNLLRKFDDRINASINGLGDAVEEINTLKEDEDVALADELFQSLTRELKLEQIKSAKKGEKINPSKVVDAILNIEENPSCLKYIGINLSRGSNEHNYLSAMQTVVNYKADLRALSQFKSIRESLYNALKRANDPELIKSYAETLELTSGTKDDYYIKHNLQRPKSLEEISARLDAIGEVLTYNKPTKKDLELLVEKAEEVSTDMGKTINAYAEQRKQRAYFTGSLVAYDVLREKTRKKIDKVLDQAYLQVIETLSKESNVLENEKFKDADQVIMKDKRGNEIYNLTRDQIAEGEKQFLEANKECFDVNNFSNPKKTKEIFEAVFDKCFPRPEVLAEEVHKKAVSTHDLKSVAEVYKEYATIVRSQKEDMNKFLTDGGSTALTCLTINQEILVLLNNFDILMSVMCANLREFLNEQYNAQQGESNALGVGAMANGLKTGDLELPEEVIEKIKYIEEDNEENLEKKIVLEGINRGEEELRSKVREDFESYTKNIYANLYEVVNNLPSRSDFKKPLEDHLRIRRPGKIRVVNRAPMPQSILGGNGVEECMLSMQAEKRHHTMILSDLVVGGESHSDATYQNVLQYTAGFVKKYTDEAQDRVVREQKEKSINDMVETIRVYALQSKENEYFIVNKDCLTKFMKLYGKVSVKNKKNLSRQDVDNFYNDFMTAINKAKDLLQSKKRLTPQGEFNDNIDTQLRRLHTMYNEHFHNENTIIKEDSSNSSIGADEK